MLFHHSGIQELEVLANFELSLKNYCHAVTSDHIALIIVRHIFKSKANGEESVSTHIAAMLTKSDNKNELINYRSIHRYLKM